MNGRTDGRMDVWFTSHQLVNNTTAAAALSGAHKTRSLARDRRAAIRDKSNQAGIALKSVVSPRILKDRGRDALDQIPKHGHANNLASFIRFTPEKPRQFLERPSINSWGDENAAVIVDIVYLGTRENRFNFQTGRGGDRRRHKRCRPRPRSA